MCLTGLESAGLGKEAAKGRGGTEHWRCQPGRKGLGVTRSGRIQAAAETSRFCWEDGGFPIVSLSSAQSQNDDPWVSPEELPAPAAIACPVKADCTAHTRDPLV